MTKRPRHTSKKAAPQCMRCSPIFVYENGHWYQCVALCELVWLHYVVFFRRDFFKRYGQNTGENRQTDRIRPWSKLIFKQESSAKMLRADICLWKSILVSLCSPLRARLNALRGFFQWRIFEEISAKYWRKSAPGVVCMRAFIFSYIQLFYCSLPKRLYVFRYLGRPTTLVLFLNT